MKKGRGYNIRKKYLCFSFVALVAIGIFILRFNSLHYNEDIPGKILLKEPIFKYTKTGSDYATIELNTGNISFVGAQGNKAIFLGSNKAIALLHEDDSVEILDLKARTVKKINFNIGKINDIAYINTSHISLSTNNGIYVIDLATESAKCVLKSATAKHSWSKYGNMYHELDIDNEKSIYKYNLSTSRDEFVINGSSPKVSSEEKILAYRRGQKLFVRDLKTGEEYVYPYNVFDYCLVEDGRYVAVVEYYRGIDLYDGYSVRIWDYKNDKTYTVVNKYYNGICTGIDWAE